MGHELVPGIHHVGIAARADLDLRDGLQDGAEVDLRRRHLEGVLAERHGQRHVRLRLVLEIDGAPVGLARSRLDELGRLGEVLLAAHDIRLQARDAKLLLARQVEMTQLADGGHIAKDPEEIELALLRQRRPQTLAKAELPLPHLARVGIVGRGPGRLAHLLLDLLQKLLDPDGRRHRLLRARPGRSRAGSPGRRSRARPGSTPSAHRRPGRAGRRRTCGRAARPSPAFFIAGRRRPGAGSFAAR